MHEINHCNLPEAVSHLLDELSSIKRLLEFQVKQEKVNPHEMLTRKEIKEQYKVCYTTIHSLMKRGNLEFTKIGRKTLFKRKDVEECFKSKRI